MLISLFWYVTLAVLGITSFNSLQVRSETRTVGDGWCSFNNCDGTTIYWSHGRGAVIRYCDSDGDAVSDLSDKINATLWAVNVEPQPIIITIQDESMNIIEQKTVNVDFIPHEYIFTYPNPAKRWISFATESTANIGWDVVFAQNSKITNDAKAKLKLISCINFEKTGTMAPTSGVPQQKYEQVKNQLGLAIGLSLFFSFLLIGALGYKVKQYRKLRAKHEKLEDAYQLLLEQGGGENMQKPRGSAQIIQSESIEMASTHSIEKDQVYNP